MGLDESGCIELVSGWKLVGSKYSNSPKIANLSSIGKETLIFMYFVNSKDKTSDNYANFVKFILSLDVSRERSQ